MSERKESEDRGGLTRRGFLGTLSLGLAGIAGIGLSMGKLVSSGKPKEGPGVGIPEDSIFNPRDDSGKQGGSGTA